jgi:CheY-like chemotaxis protein
MQLEPLSLLISDDDQAFRETLRGVFEPQGFRTLLADNGEEALRILLSDVVHVAVFDMHMPRLTGLDLLRLAKQYRSRLPCIILSADLDEWIIEQAHRADAFSVLQKPVTRLQITGIVRQALQKAWDAARVEPRRTWPFGAGG